MTTIYILHIHIPTIHPGANKFGMMAKGDDQWLTHTYLKGEGPQNPSFLMSCNLHANTVQARATKFGTCI